MSLKDKIVKADTRDMLSVGALMLLGYGMITGYFSAEAVMPVLALVFGFWFGQKRIEAS